MSAAQRVKKALEVPASVMGGASFILPTADVAELAETHPAESNMTANQYRKAIEALGLSQHRAAEFLGVSPRTSQGYALGEYPVPEAIAKLLRLMLKLGLKPEDVQ
jgi:hypothetical protein